jgi:hypothetical protein
MKTLSIRQLALLGGLVGVIAGFEPPHAAVATTTVCMPTDSLAVLMVRNYQALVVATDSLMVSARQFVQLSSGSPSGVSYVTNNATCNSAAAAYYAAIVRTPPTTPSGAVYVWQVGMNYVVFDTAATVGEWRLAATLSKRFKVLITYSM